jgi:hypothetical protein
MPIFCPSSESKRWSLNYFVFHRGIQCRSDIAISLLFQKAKRHLKCSMFVLIRSVVASDSEATCELDYVPTLRI